MVKCFREQSMKKNGHNVSLFPAALSKYDVLDVFTRDLPIRFDLIPLTYTLKKL